MSAALQADFPLFLIKPEDANVAWLIGVLQESGWMTRKQILLRASRPAVAYNERWVRALVAAAGPKIVKGQKGFNHIDNCSIEDLRHCANQSKAQGILMLKYAVALQRAAHARIGT